MLLKALNAVPSITGAENSKNPAEKLLENEKAEKGSKASLNPFEEDDDEDPANPFEHVSMPQEVRGLFWFSHYEFKLSVG